MFRSRTVWVPAVMVLATFGCTSTSSDGSNSPEPTQEPEIYGEVLDQYWGDFSPSLKVTTCDLATNSRDLAASTLVRGLEADMDVDINERDSEAWIIAAEQLLRQKCGEPSPNAANEDDDGSGATPEGIELQLWIEFWDTDFFTTDGETCEATLEGVPANVFREGSSVELLSGDGVVLSNASLRPSFHRASVLEIVPQDSNIDYFQGPCVVRAIFENVPAQQTYKVNFAGSDFASDWVFTSNDVENYDGKLLLLVE